MAPATLIDNSDIYPHSSRTPNSSSNPVKSSKSPLPQVHEFDRATVTVDEIVNALKTAGGVIVRNLVGQEEVDHILTDVNPYLEADQPWDGDFFPQQTRRVCGLMGKSLTFATSLVGNPLWLGVSDALLTSRNSYVWVGDKKEETVSPPQLHNTIVYRIGPGARAQGLHRDDVPHYPDHAAVSEHVPGRDCAVGLFVGGTRTTKENGATRFIPGSHLWDYREGPPREEQTFYAELNPGDAFMMLSGCFHAGSANTTENEDRILLSTFNTRAWLRQEENQFLANSLDSIRGLPLALQARMGYGLSRPFLGWVDLQSPMLLLHPEGSRNEKEIL